MLEAKPGKATTAARARAARPIGTTRRSCQAATTAGELARHHRDRADDGQHDNHRPQQQEQQQWSMGGDGLRPGIQQRHSSADPTGEGGNEHPMEHH
jgi:hypothetical protein